MTFLELDLSIIFVLVVILIWFWIAYQFVLTIFGYINFIKSIRHQRTMESASVDLPTCTVLIPAHNEEKVIGATLASMLRLNYPKDKLRIIVINDGSTDRTKDIILEYSKSDPRVELYDVPAGEGGKGKSRALNLGFRRATSEFLAIYDADNTPERDSLRYLATELALDNTLGAVIGKFRTVNKNATLLTRFINIETLSFQSMLQAGRWQLHSIATLPGTNFVVRTKLMQDLGGWDEEALTEDSELSIRIYEAGYKIKFIPYALTYEQEPETWGVWLRQRMRWVRGNNYVIAKFWREIPKFSSRRMAFDMLYTLSLYYIFFFAVVLSDILFIVSGANLVSITLPGPYTFVWVMAFVLFILEILLAISYDGEDSMKNVVLIILMYFWYCQLWIVVVVRAVYKDYFKKEKRVWQKTERYDVRSSTAKEPSR